MPVVSLSCPNCGAPVDFPNDETMTAKCPYCRASVQRKTSPKPDSQPTPVVIIQPPSQSSGGKGFVTSLLVIVLIAGCIVPIFAFAFIEDWFGSAFQGTVSETFPNLPMLSTPEMKISSYSFIHLEQGTEEDAPALFLGIGQGGDYSYVYLDVNAEEPVRWMIPVEGIISGAYNRFTMDHDRVYLVQDTRLSARNREIGEHLWAVPLSDKVPYDCEPCIYVVDQAVAILTIDGKLSGYNSQTGRLLWQVTLNGTPRSMALVGGKVVVKDEEDSRAVVFRMFNPQTGEEYPKGVPECPNTTFSNSVQYTDIYTPILADRTHIYAFAGWYEPGCYQKWSGVTGQLIEQVTFPNTYYSNPTFYPYVIGDGLIASATNDFILAFRTSDGAYNPIPAERDTDMEALAISDGVMVFKATEQRGTPKPAFWGYNFEGDRLFTVAAGAGREMSSSTIVSGEEWFWMVSQTDFLLFEANNAKPYQLTIEKINLNTGISSGKTSIPVGPERSIIYQVQPIGIAGDTAWVMANQTIIGINLADSSVRLSWP